LSCTRPVPSFDAERAFADLVRQTEFGPRVPGTAPHKACADWLVQQLSACADSVWRQEFTVYVPLVGDSLTFTNITARFAARHSKHVLLGAHWDTRPYADFDSDTANWRRPFDGANDGASGVALLLEIARAMAETPPPVGVDIAFFDGEDLGRSGADDEWCLGSRYFASHLPVKYDWVIIADMIGDRDLTIYREGYSYRHAKELQDRVWNVAAELGDSAFRPELEYEIVDDHLPFLMHGIPAIDLIDLRYPYWHTTEDTVDKCSAESLGRIGRVILQVVYGG
jgi:Zn-dependent M28 family amino/carboxypeptidase